MPDEVARLISKDIPAEFGEKCFTFYYIMKGKHIGFLDLHLKKKSNEIVNLWRKNGHQGPDWYNAAVNLPELEEPYKVISKEPHKHHIRPFIFYKIQLFPGKI